MRNALGTAAAIVLGFTVAWPILDFLMIRQKKAVEAEEASQDKSEAAEELVSSGETINGTANSESLIGTEFADIINGLAGNDSIDGRGGNDTINGGEGRDTLFGGGGDDNFVISYGQDKDTIQDFTVDEDNLHFDLSDLNAADGITAAETDTLISFATGAPPVDTLNTTTVVVATIDDDASTAADINGANVILLNGGATTFANVGAAVDAFEATGLFTITHQSNIADDDSFIFAYENSTSGNVHIAVASFEQADDESGGADVIADNDLLGTDLVELVGVTDVTTLDAADFDFIA